MKVVYINNVSYTPNHFFSSFSPLPLPSLSLPLPLSPLFFFFFEISLVLPSDLQCSRGVAERAPRRGPRPRPPLLAQPPETRWCWFPRVCLSLSLPLSLSFILSIFLILYSFIHRIVAKPTHIALMGSLASLFLSQHLFSFAEQMCNNIKHICCFQVLSPEYDFVSSNNILYFIINILFDVFQA